jgi:hypothetical protein
MKYKKLIGNVHVFNSFKSHLTRVFRGNFITKSNPFQSMAGYFWEISYDTINIIGDQVINQLTGNNVIQDNYGSFRSYYRQIDDGKLVKLFKEILIIDLGNFVNSVGILGEKNPTIIKTKVKTFLVTNQNYKCLPLTNIFINLSLMHSRIDDVNVSSNKLMSKVTVIIQAFASQFTVKLIDKTNFQGIVDAHNSKYSSSSFKGKETGEMTWDSYPVHLGFLNALVKYAGLDYNAIDANNNLPAIGDFFEIHIKKVTINKDGEIINVDADYLEQFTLPSDGVDLFTVSFNKALNVRPCQMPSIMETDYMDQYTDQDIENHNEVYDINEFTQKYLPMIYSKNVKTLKSKLRANTVIDQKITDIESSYRKVYQTVYYSVDSMIEKKIIASLFSGIEITNYGLPSSSGGNSSGVGPKGPNPTPPSGGDSSPKSGGTVNNPNQGTGGGDTPPEPTSSQEQNNGVSDNPVISDSSDVLKSFPLLDREIEDSLLEVASDGLATAEDVVEANNRLTDGFRKAGGLAIRHIGLPVALAVIKDRLVGTPGLVNIQNHITNKLTDEVNLNVNPTLGLNLGRR